MLGDLHVHTRFSDGSYEIREALAEASRRGLDYISFVDHDTVEQTSAALKIAAAGTAIGPRTDGEAEPESAAAEIAAASPPCDGAEPGGEDNLRAAASDSMSAMPLIIPGVEISAYDFSRGRKVHILGYGYDAKASSIRGLCDPLIRRRHENTLMQAEKLREAGYSVDEEALKAVAFGEGGAGKWFYKQHIMLVLMAAGSADAVYGPLYKSLFKGEGICSRDITYVDARDAVKAVVEDGGLAVLAHPGQTDSWDFIPDLVEAGLSGIELYHEDHGKAEHRKVRAAAKRYGLFFSGGSDDHGDWGSEYRMGEIRTPFGALDEMKKRGAARIVL